MANTTNQSSNKESKIVDIHERIYQFVLRVINLTKVLTKTSQNLILINQVVRSVTSMGLMIKKRMEQIVKKTLLQNMRLFEKNQKRQIIGYVLLQTQTLN